MKFQFTQIKYIIIFILMTFGELTFAQNTQLLKGEIIADSLSGFQIEIINLTTKNGTVSKEDGTFTIEVTKGDSILFSSIQYKPVLLEITSGILKEKNVKIHLKESINLLSAVHISNNDLTGDLTKDAKHLYYFNQEKVGIPIVKNRRSVAERRLYAGSGGLDGLFNLFSGRAAMLRRQLEYERAEKKKQEATQLVTRDFFRTQLKIPEDKIDLFLYYCLDDEAFPSTKSPKATLKLIQFFLEKAKSFKARQKETEVKKAEEQFSNDDF